SMLANFLKMPEQAERLADARTEGPVKGYPIRTDFGRNRCIGERLLLVGEAAGLVNPLTGEGIDYALESARLAAEHLFDSFAAGSFSSIALSAYERALYQKYASLFAFSRRVRGCASRSRVMSGLVLGARLHPGLRDAFTSIMMGHVEGGSRAVFGRIARAGLGA
ncbi:MAG: hypothetical protein R3300_10150, partial [Candidatus Promineifilaceae bacterium]|nr:hypothetical protein [Candidatus Promineifilaceae bacterium]